ncbi:MAG: VCBS repeat-containing protein [Verrucomicrobiales bacterium]|nr:VCBS repeat-containing protein [Verrucomicrobiales bacterium]
MSVRLGRHYLPQDHIKDYRQHKSLDYIPSSFFGTGIARQRIIKFGGFPKTPLLSHEDWLKIVAYYGENAPSELETPPQREHTETASIFEEHTIPAIGELSNKWISLHYSEDKNLLFAGSEEDSSLKYIDPKTFGILHSTPYPSTPVSILQNGSTLYVLTVGSMISTDELKAGLYVENPETKTKKPLSENLPRSVHLQQVHLGPENPLAFLVSGFGNTVGEVSLVLENASSWLQLPVSNRQGSIASYFVDMNGDGRLEIVSLISAGAEGVYQYQHVNGNVVEKQLLSFPSSYGSNAMKLADWDDDGDLDIFITHGDNGDYDPVLKPYHGVRIYENKGMDIYEQAFFYPMYGASGLEIEDFDLDGDLDIAAISFFPNWEAEAVRSFVYLENRGQGQFAESHLKKGDLSRWVVLESGDFDNDGDYDILLGTLHFEYAVPQSTVQAWQKNPISLMYLENTTR